MSFQANRRQSQPDDGGYALPIVIVVIAVGAMVAIALLGYAAALLKAGADDADSLLHLYAADAGIAAMKKQLKKGESTLLEPLMVGGIKVDVTAYTSPTPTPTPDGNPPPVTLPPTATPMPAEAIRPGLPNPLVAEPYEEIIRYVPAGSVLDIRWGYSTTTAQDPPSDGLQNPPYTPPSIKAYWLSEKGLIALTTDPCPDNPQGDNPQVNLRACYNVPDTRNLRIVFDSGTERVWTRQLGRSPPYQNEDSRTLGVIAAPGGSSLSPGTPAGQVLGSLPGLPTDHTVESKADAVTVTAYIRQIPQWCLDDSSDDLDVGRTYVRCDDVRILSWKPYPRDPPDEDEDP